MLQKNLVWYRNNFHLLAYIKKVLTPIWVVLLFEYPYVQLTLLILVNLMYLGLLVLTRPYRSQCVNVMRIISELCFLSVLVLVFVSHFIYNTIVEQINSFNNSQDGQGFVSEFSSEPVDQD